MRISFKIILYFFFITVCSCKKDTEIIGQDGIKQIRFYLPGDITLDGSTRITDPQSHIYKFNIDHYAEIDSVIFSAWTSVPTPGNKSIIELYNVTDAIPISGSTIEGTTSAEPVLYQSDNLKDGFPRKEITLGLRLTGELSGEAVNATGAYLYIYRK